MKNYRPIAGLAAVLAVLWVTIATLCYGAEELLAPAPDSVERPSLGHAIRCRVVEVYDGDTITVEITQRVRVRLLDCWSPEVRTRDETEKAAGLRAKANLEALSLHGDGMLYVPTAGADRVDDVLTFGRVLGHVWVDGLEASLSEAQVAAGLASTTKNGALGE